MVLSDWNTYAPPRCRTSQFCRTFIPRSVSLWNDLADPVLDGVGLAGFKSRANAFFVGLTVLSLLCLLLFSLSLLSFYGLVLWGWGLRTDSVDRSLPGCLATFFDDDDDLGSIIMFFQ